MKVKNINFSNLNRSYSVSTEKNLNHIIKNNEPNYDMQSSLSALATLVASQINFKGRLPKLSIDMSFDNFLQKEATLSRGYGIEKFDGTIYFKNTDNENIVIEYKDGIATPKKAPESLDNLMKFMTGIKEGKVALADFTCPGENAYITFRDKNDDYFKNDYIYLYLNNDNNRISSLLAEFPKKNMTLQKTFDSDYGKRGAFVQETTKLYDDGTSNMTRVTRDEEGNETIKKF